MCCNNLRKYWGVFLPFLGHMPRFIPSISLIWWADIHKAFIYPNEMKIECWKLAMYIWDEMSTADVRLQPNDCFKIGLCFHLWFERKSALWNCWINIAAIIHTHTQCPTVILVQMKVNVMIYVLCTSQAWLLFCLNCTEIMVKGWICALNVMPSNIHTLCCYPFTHCLKICLIF